VQRNSGRTESMHQRTAPIAWSDDGNAALQTPSPERPSAPMTGWYFKLSSTETGFPARGAKQVRVCGFQ
jgi:hypothetical protein